MTWNNFHPMQCNKASELVSVLDDTRTLNQVKISSFEQENCMLDHIYFNILGVKKNIILRCVFALNPGQIVAKLGFVLTKL